MLSRRIDKYLERGGVRSVVGKSAGGIDVYLEIRRAAN